MTCTEFGPLLSELADSGLTGEARARVEAHVETCAACRAQLADIRRIRQTARSLPKMAPPEGLWNKVRARVDAETGQAKARVVSIQPRRGWFGGHKWAVLAAAAVLLVLALDRRGADDARQRRSAGRAAGVDDGRAAERRADDGVSARGRRQPRPIG